MTCFLIAYWKYLQGWGWPQETSEARRQGLRGSSPPGQVWFWSLLAGGLGLASSIAFFIVAHRVVFWPHSERPDLSPFTAFTLVPTLLMSAIVAGVSEEAGFRGYMQGLLERRYRPAAAIAIASMVFGVAHLTHGAFLPAILFDIGWGALYGILTYLSGSILPAIILHGSADALEFILAWRFPTRAPLPMVWQVGPDAAFLVDCALAVLSGVSAVWAFLRLARLRRSLSVPQDCAPMAK